MSRFKDTNTRQKSEKPSRENSEEHQEDDFKPLKPEKFIIIGLVIICLIACVFFGMQGFKNYKKEQRKKEIARKEQQVEYVQPLKLTKYVLRPKQYRVAREVVENFLAAQSLEDALPYIGTPKSDSELLKKYYEPIDQLVELKYSKGYQYEDGYRAASFFAYVGNGEIREIIAYANGNEDYKVDWNSFTLSEDIPFTVYLETRPEKVLSFRSYCYVSTYYPKDFPESDYQSLKLTDYVGNNSVHAFVKREDFASDVLAQALLSSENKLHGQIAIRATVTVKKLDDSLQSVEILDATCVDWSSSYNGKTFR